MKCSSLRGLALEQSENENSTTLEMNDGFCTSFTFLVLWNLGSLGRNGFVFEENDDAVNMTGTLTLTTQRGWAAVGRDGKSGKKVFFAPT